MAPSGDGPDGNILDFAGIKALHSVISGPRKVAADLNAWLMVWQSRRSRLAVSENRNGMRWFAHIQIGHATERLLIAA
jgi:hypothetical protein